MTDLVAWVSGIGVRGPGLPDWQEAAAVLSGERPWARADTVLPVPATLPPAERRRAGRVVRLAFAAGFEAASRAGADPVRLPVVFASSGGDGDNCHEICQTLASASRALSPTRFHNSVHNSPAGYWSIAAAAQVATTTVCAHDAGFAAGLLETFAQVAVTGAPTALVAYDLDYPPPLHATRPIAAPFALGLVLQPVPGPRAIARLSVRLGTAEPVRIDHPQLEALRASIPAAQGLVLLEAIAVRRPAKVNIPYLAPQTLHVEVSPCG